MCFTADATLAVADQIKVVQTEEVDIPWSAVVHAILGIRTCTTNIEFISGGSSSSSFVISCIEALVESIEVESGYHIAHGL